MKCPKCNGSGNARVIDRAPTTFVPTISEVDCTWCWGSGSIRKIDWYEWKTHNWIRSHRPLFWKLALSGAIMITCGFLLTLSPLATYTYQPLGILSLISSGAGFAVAIISVLVWLSTIGEGSEDGQ